MYMGVVADDVTGSNDIGIMFAKMGCLTHVYDYREDLAHLQRGTRMPDIVILNTNSRLDPPEEAYLKVSVATKKLRDLGCTRYHNKTCSVFRGNIGIEFDAMLDVLEGEFAIVVLGFPKNGRTTVDGIHFVHGVKLEESEFRNDPVHPMKVSNLVEILQAQTHRKVALIAHQVVDQGVEPLRSQVQAMRSQCQYLILDVTGQEALKTIAAAVGDEAVLCGSSAIAEELPPVWGVPPHPHSRSGVPHLEEMGILVVAGSLMPQTAAQIDFLKHSGTSVHILEANSVFDPQSGSREICSQVGQIVSQLRLGSDVVLHSPNGPEQVAYTRQLGRIRGYGYTEISRLVSDTLAEITRRVLADTGQNRLIVAGGETSDAVCSSLGITGMRIWQEIQPGLPSCISLNHPSRLLVLKSGSFGKPNFFQQALEHLREQ